MIISLIPPYWFRWLRIWNIGLMSCCHWGTWPWCLLLYVCHTFGTSRLFPYWACRISGRAYCSLWLNELSELVHKKKKEKTFGACRYIYPYIHDLMQLIFFLPSALFQCHVQLLIGHIIARRFHIRKKICFIITWVSSESPLVSIFECWIQTTATCWDSE